jgi:hypothetical protein
LPNNNSNNKERIIHRVATSWRQTPIVDPPHNQKISRCLPHLTANSSLPIIPNSISSSNNINSSSSTINVISINNIRNSIMYKHNIHTLVVFNNKVVVVVEEDEDMGVVVVVVETDAQEEEEEQQAVLVVLPTILRQGKCSTTNRIIVMLQQQEECCDIQEEEEPVMLEEEAPVLVVDCMAMDMLPRTEWMLITMQSMVVHIVYVKHPTNPQ